MPNASSAKLKISRVPKIIPTLINHILSIYTIDQRKLSMLLVVIQSGHPLYLIPHDFTIPFVMLHDFLSFFVMI